MISISQQQSINKSISQAYKAIADKMAELNEIEYEIDTPSVFFDMNRPEVPESTHNQQLANKYNKLNKMFDDVNRTSIILSGVYNSPDADYSKTNSEVLKFKNDIIRRIRSL